MAIESQFPIAILVEQASRLLFPVSTKTMKLVWNSLLISLSLLLPTSTSIVLAEPTTVLEETAPHIPAGTRRILSPEQLARHQKLQEADKLYLAGDVAGAERLYRQVKTPFSDSQTEKKPEAIFDPAQLSPTGQVYWREAETGEAEKRESQVFTALELLVDRHPEFIPGQLRFVQALQASGRSKEALQILERLTTVYPHQPELLKEKIKELAASEKWLDASIAARQFALFYPEHPEAAEFTRLADENLNRYKKHLRTKLRERAIAGSIIGGLSWFLTGSPYGTISSVQTAFLLLRGETAIGDWVAKSAKRELRMVEDREVLDYVDEVGQKLAKVAGRSEFKYEFHVVLSEDLNAFALPGGKIFVNAGARLPT